MAFEPNINIQTWAESNSVGQNLNFLAPTQFVLTMSAIRDVAFTCQTVNIPNISLGESTQFTRIKDVPVPGDKVTFGQLITTFLIDENMVNYKSIYDWMRAIGTAVNTNEYDPYIRDHAGATPNASSTNPRPIAPTMSDATLTIYNSSNNANVEVRFKDLFPTSLEGVQFDTTDTSFPYLIGTASFTFSYYDIVKL